MNRAEAALRQCNFGPALRAVIILDRWTPEHREQFRAAFEAEDWTTVFRLCMDVAGTSSPPERQVLLHLMDATEPEDPALYR